MFSTPCIAETSPTHRVFKIEILKISGSALAAEICAGPHNRLLRCQHCSSLCSQSEGHEHVANMTNALGHNFVDFQLVLGRHNIRPPHFASKVSYSASPQASAKCPRDAPCCDATLACYLLKNEPKFSWILNTLPNTALTSCPIQGRPHLSKPQTYPPFFAFPTGACCRKSNSPIRPLCLSANHAPDTVVSRPRCECITYQTRTCLAPDAGVSRPRRADKSYFPRILDNQPIGIIK